MPKYIVVRRLYELENSVPGPELTELPDDEDQEDGEAP